MTIDRPARRNALRGETVAQLLEGLKRAEEDPEVRVLCLTGAGDKVFCAGADLAAGADSKALTQYAELLEAMVFSGTPLIARVAGHCLGGGLGLALACDMAYAADDVTFRAPEVNVGLFPMMVAALLPRGGATKKLREVVFTARKVPAAEAEALGLITRALPRDGLEAEVDRILEEVAGKAPLAVARGRHALARIDHPDLKETLSHLCGELGALMRTEDVAEGMTAFLQKRPTKWKGK
jgi:enoyl-CoA hydratase/carnithine racemase